MGDTPGIQLGKIELDFIFLAGHLERTITDVTSERTGRRSRSVTVVFGEEGEHTWTRTFTKRGQEIYYSTANNHDPERPGKLLYVAHPGTRTSTNFMNHVENLEEGSTGRTFPLNLLKLVYDN